MRPKVLLLATTLLLTLLAGPGAASVGEDASTVEVVARGRLGTEGMRLTINGEAAGEWSSLDTSLGTYSAVAGPLTIESLRVEAVAGGWPQSVVVDAVVIDGQRFETESPGTASVGSWNEATGCVEGNKRSEWLQCSAGWFEYTDTHGLTLGNSGPVDPAGTPVVIFDTDMGPDIDDVLALAALHAYAKADEAEIAAVTISRNSDTAAHFVDMVNTYYGKPNIPIGTFRGSTSHDNSDHAFTADIVDAGNFPHQLQPASIGEGYRTMRRALAEADDGSVVIVQVGFSTNTAELLLSGPDDISPLTGLELVSSKARLLSMMGGRNGSSFDEFNIAEDIDAARTVAGMWPVDLIQSDGDLGHEIIFPLESVPGHAGGECAAPSIVGDAYRNSDFSWHVDNPPLYDMRTWDITSVIAAIEPPADYFPVSGPGTFTVQNGTGLTSFSPSPSGRHVTLGKHWDMTAGEKQAAVDRMVDLVNVLP